MQMGGVGQTSGKDMWVTETTTINQWQRIRAKGSYGKRVESINAKLPEYSVKRWHSTPTGKI